MISCCFVPMDFTEKCRQKKIAQILKTDQNMNDMCTSLVQEALEAGGRDNITVICLKI